MDPGRPSPPLSGFVLVELATGIPGGYCTKLLADGGADVVKVEADALTVDWRPFLDAGLGDPVSTKVARKVIMSRPNK